MAMFLAYRIMDETVKYKDVFAKTFFKKYQDDVDVILTAEGRSDLIDK